jgi:hypothetical protein
MGANLVLACGTIIDSKGYLVVRENFTGAVQKLSISDDGLKHLQTLVSLEDLNLDGSQVGDRGLAYLESLTNLETLCLSDTNVTDAGLTHLKSLTKLRQLAVYRTEVTAKGIDKLQQALPNCTISRWDLTNVAKPKKQPTNKRSRVGRPRDGKAASPAFNDFSASTTTTPVPRARRAGYIGHLAAKRAGRCVDGLATARTSSRRTSRPRPA